VISIKQSKTYIYIYWILFQYQKCKKRVRTVDGINGIEIVKMTNDDLNHLPITYGKNKKEDGDNKLEST
jgi:hypothetical protein